MKKTVCQRKSSSGLVQCWRKKSKMSQFPRKSSPKTYVATALSNLCFTTLSCRNILDWLMIHRFDHLRWCSPTAYSTVAVSHRIGHGVTDPTQEHHEEGHANLKLTLIQFSIISHCFLEGKRCKYIIDIYWRNIFKLYQCNNRGALNIA